MGAQKKNNPSAFVFVLPLTLILLGLTSCKEQMKIIAGNAAPIIAGIELSAPNPRVGTLVTVITTASDDDGDVLSFTWLLKARPTASQITISGAGVSATFTPDVDGSYTAQCTVSDGTDTDVATLDITVLSALDITPPTITGVDPANQSTSVPVTTNISAVFSEGMDTATLSSSTFQLFVGMNPVTGTVTYDAGTRMATFNPTSDLATGTTYTGKVGTGAADTADNHLAQEYSWTFTTLAETPPAVTDYAFYSTNFPASSIIASSFSGDFRVRNQGTLSGAQTIGWTVYRSSDTVVDGGDTVVQTSTLSPLPAGTNSSLINYSGTWPGTPGNYYILIELTAGDDANQTNNLAVSNAINVYAIVDYLVTNPAFPLTGTVDGAISGNFKIMNGGTLNGSAAIDWTVHRSDDATLSGEDTLVASGSRAQLNAGITSASIPFTGTWPATAGTYYLIISVSAADEGAPDNNALASPAIVVINAGRIVRAGQTGSISYSDDGGITWTPATVTPATSNIFRDLATNGTGMWVVVGDNRTIYHSLDDGVTWAAATSITGSVVATNELTGVAYGNGAWVISGDYNSGEVTSLHSSDGMNWTLKGIGTPIGNGLDAVTYDPTNTRWVASNLGNGYGYTSASYDTAWSNAITNSGKYLSLTHGGGRIIGVGAGLAAYLTAGTTWTSATTLPYSGSTSAFYNEAEYDGSMVWVATGYRTSAPVTLLIYSTNGGVVWTSATSPGTDSIVMRCVTYDPKSQRFVASGNDGAIKYSEDGNTWTDVSTGTTLDYYAIQAGP